MGRGRPPRDDREAVRYVLEQRYKNPRVGYREAARRYFQANPEKLKAKLESEARRVGDKAARLGGRLPTPSELQLLKRLQWHLAVGGDAIRELLTRWERHKPSGKLEGTGADGGNGMARKTVSRRTGPKAAKAAGRLLRTSKSAAVRSVAASDLSQAAPKPRPKAKPKAKAAKPKPRPRSRPKSSTAKRPRPKKK